MSEGYLYDNFISFCKKFVLEWKKKMKGWEGVGKNDSPSSSSLAGSTAWADVKAVIQEQKYVV